MVSMTDESRLLKLLGTIGGKTTTGSGKGWTVDEALAALNPAGQPESWTRAEVVAAFEELVERTWAREAPGHFSGLEAPPMVYAITANGRERLLQGDEPLR